MRILLLAHCFAHNNANTFRYRYLCEQLAREGHAIDVVGDNPLTLGYIPDKNVTYYALRQDLSSASAWLPIFWLTLIEFFKLKLLWLTSLRHHYIGYMVMLNGTARYRINKLLKTHQYDAVVMSVVPWTLYTLAGRLSRHGPLIIDISDPLYKNAFVDRKPTGNKRFARFEAKALKYASKIAVMSEPLVDLYHQEISIPIDKLTFVSPSARTDDYRRDQTIIRPLGKPLRMLYAGTIYPGYRDLEELLPAVRASSGVRLEVISQSCGRREECISYHSWLPQDQLMEQYQQADLLVFIDNFFGYQIPSKIFELLALNKPVLFVYDKRNTYLYNKLQAEEGIFFTTNDRHDIQRTIKQIKLQNTIPVHYTFDLEPYSNANLCKTLITLIQTAIHNHVQR